MQENCTIAVVGGDDRELVLIRELSAKGYLLHVFGFPSEVLPPNTTICKTISDAVSGKPIVILPMSGIKDNGLLHTKYTSVEVKVAAEDFNSVELGTCVFVGIASQFLKSMSESIGFSLIETAELDSVAIPNSVPTAEGAIQLAMENLPITIHGSHALVTGFGRVAQTLAGMLKGIGADVTVAARNSSQRSQCIILGFQTVELKNLAESIESQDIIFNTVPAMVLTENLLSIVRKNTLIIDLASSPGGTDFAAAKKLGLKAILALGLPGKVAPLSSGRILASVYPQLIDFCLSDMINY